MLLYTALWLCLIGPAISIIEPGIFFFFSKKRGFGKTLICFSKSNTTPKYQYSNGVLFKRGFYPIPVKGSTSPIGLLCKFYIIQVIFFQNISLFVQLPITFYTKTLAMLNLEHYFFFPNKNWIKVWQYFKVHIFWKGHKILWNLPLTFDWHYIGQKLGEDFAKFCGLLRIYEL